VSLCGIGALCSVEVERDGLLRIVHVPVGLREIGADVGVPNESGIIILSVLDILNLCENIRIGAFFENHVFEFRQHLCI
jgi:hypothetical protein